MCCYFAPRYATLAYAMLFGLRYAVIAFASLCYAMLAYALPGSPSGSRSAPPADGRRRAPRDLRYAVVAYASLC
jgi:hypothetical protein